MSSSTSFSTLASSSPRHSPLLCLPVTRSQLHLWMSPLFARYVAPGKHRKGPVVLTGRADTSWVDDSATLRLSQDYTFSLGSGFVSRRSTHSSLVLSSSCEAEIYAEAMAAQELRWLTYLLTNLGEQPRLAPFLYQRGQLRLAYVATRANTADIFTKALPSGDHERFSTVLGVLALLFLTGLEIACMVFDQLKGIREEATELERELAMRFMAGATTSTDVTEAQRQRALGKAMDLNALH
ncbi:unnamed protein product [Closterium sp. NIES-53]